MIQPTIGRKVHFYDPTYFYNLAINDFTQPCDATVVYVWNDRCVNLVVRDHEGNQHAMASVQLVQPEDDVPGHAHARWMDYQVGQAAKTDEVNAKLDDLRRRDAVYGG